MNNSDCRPCEWTRHFESPAPISQNGIMKVGGHYFSLPASYMDVAAKAGYIEPEPDELGVWRYCV